MEEQLQTNKFASANQSKAMADLIFFMERKKVSSNIIKFRVSVQINEC